MSSTTPQGSGRSAPLSSGGRRNSMLDQARDRARSVHMGFRNQFKIEEFEVAPQETVYSYFMFVAPMKATCIDKCMAYVLVLLALTIQSTLLYCIFDNVVMDQVYWQQGILHNPSNNGLALIMPQDDSKCNDGSSLCNLIDGMISCAPPSVQLTGRWDELDTDDDGVWTYQEAQDHAKRIRCKYGVDARETFKVISHFVKAREDHIWIDPDLKADNAIKKQYFTYAVGDIVMCGYRDEQMCANILRRGYLDSALEFSTVPRIGNTTEDALHYCYKLLRPGGACEMILPSAYAVWKVESKEECGVPYYEKFIYKHPISKDPKSLLAVDYEGPDEYRKSQTPEFLMYKLSLICIWLLAMVTEAKKIQSILVWMISFPAASDVGESEVVEEVVETMSPKATPRAPQTVTQIVGIAMWQRVMVGIVTLLRSAMLAVLTWVGTSLLLRNTDYIDLLFDAVSLVFVLEIASILYNNVLRQELRTKIEAVLPMDVRTIGFSFMTKYPGIEDAVCLFGVIGVSAYVLYQHHHLVVKPVYDALNCACLQEGHNCFEASTFSKPFWHDYWKDETPEVFREVDAMRLAYENRSTVPKKDSKVDPAENGAHRVNNKEADVHNATTGDKTRHVAGTRGRNRRKNMLLDTGHVAAASAAPAPISQRGRPASLRQHFNKLIQKFATPSRSPRRPRLRRSSADERREE